MNRTIRIVPRVKMFSFQKRHSVFISLCLLCAGILLAQSQKGPNVEKQSFGTAPDGQSIDIYTLKNSKGMEARITNFGATLVSLRVPDRAGKFDDVVLGFDSLDGYVKLTTYYGATIGRYGNRIAHGQFVLDGKTYNLPKNNGENTLHGGINGFNKHVWEAKPVTTKAGEELELTYLSKDGEEGFPGNLSVKVIYKLAADKNDLTIDYSATTDKDTVLNLTNHSYFNLAGAGSGDILKDVLTIHASKFTPVDAGLIPTGELKDVTGTPFDFRKPTAVGARIDQNDPQLQYGKGYDLNWVLDRKAGSTEMIAAAEVYEPTTGRVLEVFTTEPGVQFYSGNHMEDTQGKDGKTYHFRGALCLETQHYPDSPNHPSFPTTELKPGETLHSTTVLKFSAR
ncbi:MAG: aldose epimerase family protein [Candidatus Acidiferrales bacterium]